MGGLFCCCCLFLLGHSLRALKRATLSAEGMTSTVHAHANVQRRLSDEFGNADLCRAAGATCAGGLPAGVSSDPPDGFLGTSDLPDLPKNHIIYIYIYN